jgi:hypothetical protein
MTAVLVTRKIDIRNMCVVLALGIATRIGDMYFMF